MAGIVVEVCAESVESALVAQREGAARIEFCDNMAEGGTTPSCGSIKVAREMLDIELYPIIRPRGGDFVYTDAEFDVMEEDVRFCGRTGCDGVVIGMLDAQGRVDTRRCARLVAAAREYGMGVTFHRAFDVACNMERALEEIVALGCERILTSGGKATALEGVEVIRELIERAAGRIVIMPGSGITPQNAAQIIAATGCREIHGTFRSRVEGSAACRPEWADFSRWRTDPQKLREIIEIARGPQSGR